jgi:hypothetical protein
MPKPAKLSGAGAGLMGGAKYIPKDEVQDETTI